MALPDVGAAIMLRMKQCTALYNDIGSPPNVRVFLQWPKPPNDIKVPIQTANEGIKFVNCLMVEPGKGGPGSVGSSLIQERVDIKYYGANRIAANNLHKIGTDFLVPQDERTKSSFVLATCRIFQIEIEGVGLQLNDPGAANWPYTLGSYIVTYSGVPVS